MTLLVTDPHLEEELIVARREAGSDHHDEVWEGTYVMAPLPNNEHQEFVGELTAVFHLVIRWAGLGRVLPGTNVTDQPPDNWEHNYRCPDVVVFLNDTAAENRGTHWFGGPDFCVEIVSPGDRSREKLGFYANVGTKELLLVDRNPWALELYRLAGKQLKLVGKSTVKNAAVLTSEIVPLTWQPVAGKARPQLKITHTDGEQTWQV